MHPKILQNFPRATSVSTFIDSSLLALGSKGFTPGNSIVGVSVCRDELCQPFVSKLQEKWGLTFDLSGLAGIPFSGKAAFGAMEHHSPIDKHSEKERYVFFGFTHIGFGNNGEIGLDPSRPGRPVIAASCGALHGYQKMLQAGTANPKTFDYDDVEMSLLQKTMHGTCGTDASIVELTKAAATVVQKEMTRFVEKTVDPSKADYAIVTGVHIHGPKIQAVQLNDNNTVVVDNVTHPLFL
eukprot:GCRY01002724.1.p1 GENE.GCRY01002724.1~~GCRY01002724.1.p1  ORF type:complete len:239 (+),score=51.54 GCRY01002724.1:191-907(+)